MSTSALSVATSTAMPGKRRRYSISSGCSTMRAAPGEVFSRSVPVGRARDSVTLSTAPSIAARAGRTSATKASPAAVSATDRVVRLNRRTSSRSSSADTAWLSAEDDTPSSRAAARKPPSRAIVVTASSSDRLGLIALFSSSTCL
ncbi:hypothetical protein D9M70_554970 [compost metagenome]